jgi:hypothetical protein
MQYVPSTSPGLKVVGEEEGDERKGGRQEKKKAKTLQKVSNFFLVVGIRRFQGKALQMGIIDHIQP